MEKLKWLTTVLKLDLKRKNNKNEIMENCPYCGSCFLSLVAEPTTLNLKYKLHMF